MRRALLLVAFALAGCAELQTASFERPVFELHGKLAAREGEDGFSGNIAWRHGERADEVLITTPLGQGVARIVRDPNGVVVTTAEPKEYRGPDAESISQEALGYRLPLAGLADWVQGRLSSKLPSGRIERYPDGRAKRLEQGGWTIDYLDYANGRPSRLRLSYPGLELRLAVTEWK